MEHLAGKGAVRALWFPRSDRVVVQRDLPTLHALGDGRTLWSGGAPLVSGRAMCSSRALVFADATFTRMHAVRVEDGLVFASQPATPTVEALALAGSTALWSSYGRHYDYGVVECWDLEADQLTQVDTETGRTSAVALTADAQHAVIAYGERGAVHSRAEGWRRTAQHQLDLFVSGLTPTTGGEVLAFSRYGALACFDVQRGAVRWRVAEAREPRRVLVSPDSRFVVTTPELAGPGPVVVSALGGGALETPRPPRDVAGWSEAAWAGARLVLRTDVEVFTFELTAGVAKVCRVWSSPAGPLTALVASPHGAVACGTVRGDVFVL